MTPHEFGKLVKIAVETGGAGEYAGQAFDHGVNWLNKAIGMPEISPGAWAGGSAMPAPTVPTPASAPRPSRYKDPSQMPGVSPAAPMPQTPAAAPRPSKYRDPSQMPGPSAATRAPAPAPSPVARPAPRPAAARPAPVQPRPTAPGVRKPPGRVA